MTILMGEPLQWAITATAGTGFMLFGYDQGVMSGLLTGTAFTAQFPEIDTNEGSHGSSSLQGTVVAIYEIGCFFGAIVCFLFGEKLGRRLFGCLAILAGTVSNGSKPAGIVAVVALFLFNFFFAVGLLAIPWLLPAEYAPLPIRIRSAALATASNWIFTFLVVEITPVSIGSIKWRTYIYLAVFNTFFLPLIYFFYPETRNLPLEQINKLFEDDKVKLHWTPDLGEAEDVTQHISFSKGLSQNGRERMEYVERSDV
ncbi:hypothetical protein F5B21DRAFT_527945 [Xylaria acuta]|nr:hypothetical protein F5B21DRAFT_527945 [Xylaria acuta]